ncbi:DJ-1/PfpI family protein [archaeon]|nr:DJ-1/PfpI family protein [archaeon]
MKKILMVIAPENFRDEELLVPKKVFEEQGFKAVVASKGTERAKGMLGAEVNIDKDIEDISINEYDALVLVGGVGAAIYLNDAKVLGLAQGFAAKGKIICGICIAPSILANAGLLKGKHATSWPSEAANLENKGAIYTGKPVTADGRIVTANGPRAAEEFGKKIAELLKGA